MAKALQREPSGIQLQELTDDDYRQIGLDEAHIGVVDEDTEKQIDEAAGSQLISIRLRKSLIDDMKLIASLNCNIGYQTLIKQILHRFVESEMRLILRRIASEIQEDDQPTEPEKPARSKRRA